MFTQINETIASGINLYDGEVLSSLDMNQLKKNIFWKYRDANDE